MALILLVAVVVLVRLLGGDAPNGATFTLSVFTVAPGTDVSTLGLGIVFGLLSFAGFEAAATLGEEARNPRRDIPRAILGTALFGGVYFTVVTAIEMMAFKPDDAGVAAFIASPALMGDLGTAYVGSWSATSSRPARRSARSAAASPVWSAPPGSCMPSAGTWLPAAGSRAPGRTPRRPRRPSSSRRSSAVIALVCAVAFGAKPFDTFLWSGTIGTLIPARRLRAGDDRLHQAHLGRPEDGRPRLAGRHPRARAGHARLHHLPQRPPLSRRGAAPLVPGGRLRPGCCSSPSS